MRNLIIGLLLVTIGQIGSFLQLQGTLKYNWFQKYPMLILLSSIPLTLIYLHSVQKFYDATNKEIWPGRLISFGVGVIVFSLMSHFLFKEVINFKTFICLLLAIVIILIQLFVK